MKLLNKLWELYERIVIFFLKIVTGGKADQKLIDKLLPFAKFCLVGVLSAVVSLGCYYIVVSINDELYILGYSIGFVLSVLNSYFWNSNFVFHKTDEKLKTITKTMMSYSFTFVLGNIILYTLIEILKVSAFIAPLINIMITTPMNFILSKFWSYKRKEE